VCAAVRGKIEKWGEETPVQQEKAYSLQNIARLLPRFPEEIFSFPSWHVGSWDDCKTRYDTECEDKKSHYPKRSAKAEGGVVKQSIENDWETRPGDLESPGSCCELAPTKAVSGL
jgi:hypothetical protein